MNDIICKNCNKACERTGKRQKYCKPCGKKINADNAKERQRKLNFIRDREYEYY